MSLCSPYSPRRTRGSLSRSDGEMCDVSRDNHVCGFPLVRSEGPCAKLHMEVGKYLMRSSALPGPSQVERFTTRTDSSTPIVSDVRRLSSGV